MRIKKTSKRPVKASKHMKLGRKITASADRKIPYDLVSMAAILRDWADMPRDAYASDEHKLLADIADTLYNVGKESAKTFRKEYAELYKQYGEAYFDQVLEDMSALDSQVSSKNIEELVEDYEDRLDSGIGAATKIRASRASRVMAARGYNDDTVYVIFRKVKVDGQWIPCAFWYSSGQSLNFGRIYVIEPETYGGYICEEADMSYYNASKKLTPADDGYDDLKEYTYDWLSDHGDGQGGFKNIVERQRVDYNGLHNSWYRDTIPNDSSVGASRRIAKRRAVKASRSSKAPRRHSKIMAGPGAGYTIEWSLERVRKVNSFDVVDVSKPDQYGTVEVTVDCDVECDVTIKSAWSYMYGFNHPIEGVPAKITRVIFDYNIVDGSGGRIDPDDYEDGTDDKEFIDEVMNFVYQLNEMDGFNIFDEEAADVISGYEFSYGGGYTHSTWDGTLLEVGKYTYADIQVTDQMIIDYVDSAVTNENLSIEYWIKVEDTGRRADDEFYESEESAREAAISMLKASEYGDSDLIIMKTEWQEILLNMEGEVDLDNPYDEEVETLYHDDYAEEPADDEE